MQAQTAEQAQSQNETFFSQEKPTQTQMTTIQMIQTH